MKTKNTMIIMLSLVMMFAFGVTANAASKANKKAAYRAYLGWINSGCKDDHGYSTEYDKFCLTRVDSDRVPELVALKTPGKYTGVYNMCIVSYKKGRAVVMSVSSGVAGAGGYRGTSSFIPRKGKIHEWSMSSGSGYESDVITKLGKKGFTKTAQGSYQWADYVGGHVKFCQWNKKNVTKAAYDRKLAKAFNQKKARNFEDLPYIPRAQMLATLN